MSRKTAVSKRLAPERGIEEIVRCPKCEQMVVAYTETICGAKRRYKDHLCVSKEFDISELLLAS